VDSALAWSKVFDAVEQVIPCSELTCTVGLEALSAKLLSCHLDYRDVGRSWLRKSLLASHLAYGGGYPVWRALNMQTFAVSVLNGAAKVAKEFAFEGDTYDPSAAPGPSKPKELASASSSSTAEGATNRFQAFLERRAKTTEEDPELNPITGRSANRYGNLLERVQQAEEREQKAADSRGASSEKNEKDANAVLAAEAKMQAKTAKFEVSVSGRHVSLVVTLPGLSHSAEASLEVAEKEVRVRSLHPIFRHALDVPLPERVNPDTCAAKWSKAKQQLSLRLLRLDETEEGERGGIKG